MSTWPRDIIGQKGSAPTFVVPFGLKKTPQPPRYLNPVSAHLPQALLRKGRSVRKRRFCCQGLRSIHLSNSVKFLTKSENRSFAQVIKLDFGPPPGHLHRKSSQFSRLN